MSVILEPFAAQAALVAPSDQCEKSSVCRLCKTLIGCRPNPIGARASFTIQYQSAGPFGCSFTFCRSFQRPVWEKAAAWMRNCWLHCTVMCHRLRESRIDGKRLGPSPIQSFQTRTGPSINSDASRRWNKPQLIRSDQLTLSCLAAAAPEACDSLGKKKVFFGATSNLQIYHG